MLQYGEQAQTSGPRDVRSSPLAARVVIADRQPLLLEGLAQVLRAFPTEAVDRCSTGAELFAALVDRQPDLAITDVRLSDPDGLTVLREVRRRGLQIPVVLMTGPLRDSEVLEGIQLGIRGLVAKDAPIEAVSHCVRTVLGGGTCLDEAVVGRAMAALVTREGALRELGQLLTAREMQVMQLVVAGVRTRDAAERLSVSEGTFKVHLHHIYQKLNVRGRDGLLAFARERGLGLTATG
jgi:two-component system, NarL family, nitrate/nitrite response regulator NarL